MVRIISLCRPRDDPGRDWGAVFHVLSGFLLPVFLAMLLVVMFGPVHRWFDARCGEHKRISAALTTAAILLIGA